MEVQKFTDFILNEARVNKKELVEELLDMFKKRPNVEMSGLANERGIYSLAGMKNYLSKYSSLAIDQAFGDIKNDKNVDLKSIYVKVSKWDKNTPYWYIGLTDAQANKLKAEYEAEEAKKNEKEVSKKQDAKKASAAKAEAKKVARKVTKKPTAKASGEGATRKPGAAPKKRATKSTKK